MSNHQCTGALPAAGLSRRAVLNRFGLGLGGIALADLVNPLRLGAMTSQATPGVLGSQLHFPPKAQARHLPVHGGRAFTDRDVRRQARAPRAQRRVPARLGPPGAAAHGHVGQPVDVAARRFAVRLLAAWPLRHVGLRPVAAHGQGRRRPVHRPIDAHRRDQPRPGDHVLPDRLADRRPPQHGRVGALRARHRYAGPAGLRRARSRRARWISRCTRGCGGAGSCPHGTRACSSAAARIPSCTSPTLPA